MRVFKIPYDMKHEEKIFGGYLSLRQVLYIMIGATSFSIIAVPINIVLKIIFIALINIFILLCAFFKPKGLRFDKLFYYAIKYVFRKKTYIYERCCK